MDDQVRVFALGGLDENGKNLQVVEINRDIFIIECGVRFPDKMTPGIDYIIPNYHYFVENKSRVKAYFLLHGHDDEIGALPYIYKEVPAPIYCSQTTRVMLMRFVKHIGMRDLNLNVRTIQPTSNVEISGRLFSFFHTCHNIADSSGVAISTSLGNIVFTSDYIVDNNAEPRYLHDMNAIAKIAEKETLLLMVESGYADKLGYTAPKHKLTPLISRAIEESRGRTFVALFTPNAYNIGEVFKLANTNHKKIVCYDEETDEVMNTFVETSEEAIPKSTFVSRDDVNRNRPQDIIILVCAYGAKLYQKIALLANGQADDKRIQINPSDTFIAAAPANVNNEVSATDAIDELYRSGATIVNLKKEFLTMHASEEDIKMMISIFKPKFYVPVKGRFRFLLANAQLAVNMGVKLNHTNTFVLDNGNVLNITSSGAKIEPNKIETGDLLVDGAGIANADNSVIEERQHLSDDGVVVMAVTISKSQRLIIAGPDVQMRGFVFLKDSDSILKTLTNIFVTAINDYLAKPHRNIDEARQIIRETCQRMVKKETGKSPIILPLIVEID
ncbi:MAG: ribonuclease J [Bacilli bacterium]|jgi:ribonuclease J